MEKRSIPNWSARNQKKSEIANLKKFVKWHWYSELYLSKTADDAFDKFNMNVDVKRSYRKLTE